MADSKCTRLLRERVNYFLENSPDDKQRERYAIAGLLESVTLECGAYAGYTYLPAAKVNYDAIEQGAEFHAEDESRRRYHTKTRSR